jgi:hypothetical protein
MNALLGRYTLQSVVPEFDSLFLWSDILLKGSFLSYCDRFDGTSDMNAATQRPGTDFGASYATIFRIYETEKYKSIATQCLQAEPILPWQQILLTVKFPKQPNCCDGRYNRERCSISGPGDPLKGVDLDSEESVNNSQPVS